MADKTTTLEEQSAAINASIRDLEHEVLRMDEAPLCQELVDRIITLKEARGTINWLHRFCTFIRGLEEAFEGDG